MKVYDATSLRNVAIVGHGGCGKTQLVSTMLFVAGAVNRIGRVDDGTTVTDLGFADQVVALVVERRIEEELLVLELEVFVLLADSALS